MDDDMRAPSHWLYPTNEASRYVLADDGKQTKVSPEALWESIKAGQVTADAWVLTSGYRSLTRSDVVWLYAGGRQYIYAMARVASVYEESFEWYADLVWDLDATRQLIKNPIPRSTFQQIPQSVRRANALTLPVLDGRCQGV